MFSDPKNPQVTFIGCFLQDFGFFTFVVRFVVSFTFITLLEGRVSLGKIFKNVMQLSEMLQRKQKH